MHVASGAAGGALAGSPLRAFALGLLLHAAGDRVPHQDIDSRSFELGSGLGALAAVALARGPLDASVFGAIGATIPDGEHLLRLPRPGGRKLFPSHRFHGWHRAGGVPAWAQVLAAGVTVGLLLKPLGGMGTAETASPRTS